MDILVLDARSSLCYSENDDIEVQDMNRTVRVTSIRATMPMCVVQWFLLTSLFLCVWCPSLQLLQKTVCELVFERLTFESAYAPGYKKDFALFLATNDALEPVLDSKVRLDDAYRRLKRLGSSFLASHSASEAVLFSSTFARLT